MATNQQMIDRPTDSEVMRPSPYDVPTEAKQRAMRSADKLLQAIVEEPIQYLEMRTMSGKRVRPGAIKEMHERFERDERRRCSELNLLPGYLKFVEDQKREENAERMRMQERGNKAFNKGLLESLPWWRKWEYALLKR